MWGMLVQPDGKIVVAGETSPAAGMDSQVLRLLDDGTRDSTPSGDGLVSLAFSSVTDEFEAVPIRSDRRSPPSSPLRLGRPGTPSTTY
jgi:hypothetical protein